MRLKLKVGGFARVDDAEKPCYEFVGYVQGSITGKINVPNFGGLCFNLPEILFRIDGPCSNEFLEELVGSEVDFDADFLPLNSATKLPFPRSQRSRINFAGYFSDDENPSISAKKNPNYGD